ncbi:AraC family transcriptional regulator [Roseiarcus sp.]|uniref:AraC family transcriptional regulator n=1 Tax=Roseiarcus sp. TaxID=1969460 RepID=UPI003F9DD159
MRDGAQVSPSSAPRLPTSRRPSLRADPHGAAAENARTALADPDFELIVRDPATSFRWHRHDYPSALARWNYHPEYEIHLIAESSGKMFVGDHIGAFGPGNLLLVGPNLPHHWVSDLNPGERITGRDVVLQFSSRFTEDARKVFPEFGNLLPVLEESRRGIEFFGDDARDCGELLLKMGDCHGLARIALFIALIERMVAAKARRVLASETYRPEAIGGADAQIGAVIEYMFANVHDVRMSAAAAIVGMNESTFSRHFKKMTGANFVDCVRKIRIAKACTLLESDSLGVTEICFECGFQNISNFNRAFRREKGMTPREYRANVRMRGAGRETRAAG